MIKFYQISASVTRKDETGKWTIIVQVPTFYLNANVQGITNEKHAATIAREMLLAVNPAAIVSTFAMEF